MAARSNWLGATFRGDSGAEYISLLQQAGPAFITAMLSQSNRGSSKLSLEEQYDAIGAIMEPGSDAMVLSHRDLRHFFVPLYLRCRAIQAPDRASIHSFLESLPEPDLTSYTNVDLKAFWFRGCEVYYTANATVNAFMMKDVAATLKVDSTTAASEFLQRTWCRMETGWSLCAVPGTGHDHKLNGMP
jgi:hypothetical protein